MQADESVSQCNCRLMQLGLALNSAGGIESKTVWALSTRCMRLGMLNFWSVSDSSELPKAHAG